MKTATTFLHAFHVHEYDKDSEVLVLVMMSKNRQLGWLKFLA